MKRIAFVLALAAIMQPLHAHEASSEEAEVRAAADRFFEAIRSEDKTDLADVMIPARYGFKLLEQIPHAYGYFVPNCGHWVMIEYPEDFTDITLRFFGNPRVVSVPVADHLGRWASGTSATDEAMHYETILISGDMAQVWGPYRFTVNGETTHCGVNSLSLARRNGEWKVGNTSFTMVPPDQCERLGAPEMTP